MIKYMNRTNDVAMFDPTINRPAIFAKQMVAMEYTVHFTQEFDHPSYYDEVVSLLMNAEEGDQINFMINNFGGRVDSLNSILNAMTMTKARVVGFLLGQGCSCASVLFLACHNYVVGENTTLMIHEQSFFVGGKASETKKQHSHYQLQNERFIREVYKDFLTPEEIESCLRGEDYYFEDHEINDRLLKREEIRQKQAQQESNDFLAELEAPFDYSTLSEEELNEELDDLKEELKKVQTELRNKRKVGSNNK